MTMEQSFSTQFSPNKIVVQNDYHTVYQLESFNGRGTASVYSVIPGVELVYLDLQTTVYASTTYNSRNMIELNHCQEGRLECRMRDGCLQYVGEGDLFMNNMYNHSKKIELPLGYYKGINITIHLEKIAEQISVYFPDFPINSHELFNRFFTHDECFMIQANEDIRRIFGGMYCIPVEARGAYYRIKIMELLIYLYYFEVNHEVQKEFYARQQVDIIKQIEKKMVEESQHKFTITELARMYCISPTTLKTTFKAVYGTPISTYMKDYRMREAASMLQQTSHSIMDIAQAVGYKSQSKFSAVFKQYYKLSPFEFRAKYQGSKN